MNTPWPARRDTLDIRKFPLRTCLNLERGIQAVSRRMGLSAAATLWHAIYPRQHAEPTNGAERGGICCIGTKYYINKSSCDNRLVVQR